jgi:2-keto-4-pentenoate hydratase/2-oxohepta-3-ene-1,7-dioic acid hydratase in catechol pathway
MRVGLGPSKGKDSASSFGPWLVTTDELAALASDRAYDVKLTGSVNGVTYSSGNLADLYWSFGEMICYASRGTRLVPGDVIACGTVGTGCILELSRVHGADAYPYLRPGDEVHLEGGPLGAIDARIRASRPVVPFRPTPDSAGAGR